MDEEIVDRVTKDGLSLASVNKRALAVFVDELIISIFVFIIFYDSISGKTSTEEILQVLSSAVGTIMILKVIYQAFFVWYQSATPGKKLLKIAVVDEKSFLKPNLTQSIIRAIVRILSENLFYLGFLWGILSPIKQTWHDKLAKTLVIDA